MGDVVPFPKKEEETYQVLACAECGEALNIDAETSCLCCIHCDLAFPELFLSLLLTEE